MLVEQNDHSLTTNEGLAHAASDVLREGFALELESADRRCESLPMNRLSRHRATEPNKDLQLE